MTTKSATGGAQYPQYRLRPGQEHIVESRWNAESPWLFEAACHSVPAAAEWIEHVTALAGRRGYTGNA